jgi:phosphohistidine phosphatase SixA
MVEIKSDRKITPITTLKIGKKKKTLILIRHAQSVENVKVIDLCDGIQRIKNFQFPTLQQILSTLSLLSLTVDSKVSELGKRQICDMKKILHDENFWKRKIDLIVCSPLSRAQDTCNGILPSDNGGVKVVTLDDLEEATIYEHIFSSTLMKRIENFKRWLVEAEEETIVIVGHSQYFKKMLQLKNLMRNCDVWQCDFSSGFEGQTSISSSSTRSYQWTNLHLLHRTTLADEHPYDKLTKADNYSVDAKKEIPPNTEHLDEVSATVKIKNTNKEGPDENHRLI